MSLSVTRRELLAAMLVELFDEMGLFEKAFHHGTRAAEEVLDALQIDAASRR